MKPIANLPIEAREKIRKAILAGRKLDAVKVYYTETNQSLLDSKKMIEVEMDRLKRNDQQHFMHSGEGVDNEMERILNCIFANKKLDAVKIYRDSTDSSLMESKQFIEELIDRLNQDCPEQFQGGSGYQTGGCATTLLLVVLAICLAMCFLD